MPEEPPVQQSDAALPWDEPAPQAPPPEEPEPVTQRQLEQYMAVKPSTINGIVGRLEEKGLLTRDACQQDARCRVLRLTEEGRRFRSDFIRIAQDTNRQMEQGFSPEEQAQLTDFLERAYRNVGGRFLEEETP